MDYDRVRRDFAEYEKRKDRMKLYHNEFKRMNKDVSIES